MTERPGASPKSSESHPPAANQPEGGGDLGAPDEDPPTAAASGSGKPDGEVDTGA
jgi:hypothetical protein